MKTCVMLLLLATTSGMAGLSKLDALSLIESGDNDSAIGCVGEVSRFQIKPQVWRNYTASQDYNNTQIAALVAEQHLRYLEGVFRRRAGREPTDFDTYVLWNAGAAYYGRIGFSADRVHRRISERANRYVNLREMEMPPAKERPTAESARALAQSSRSAPKDRSAETSDAIASLSP
jgi:hypothetical protein